MILTSKLSTLSSAVDASVGRQGPRRYLWYLSEQFRRMLRKL